MKSLRKYRVVVLFVIDIITICLAYLASAFLLTSNNVVFTEKYNTLISNTIIVSVVVYQIIFQLFGVYKNITRYENGKDYIKYISLSAFSGLIVFLISYIFKFPAVQTDYISKYTYCSRHSFIQSNYKIYFNNSRKRT